MDKFKGEQPRKPYVFDVTQADFDAVKGTPEEQEQMRKFDRIAKEYKDKRATHTLDLQITKEAYERIKDKPGTKAEGYSRLVVMEIGGETSYHLIPSPFESVWDIKKSDNPNREELILVAKGLNLFEGRQVRFELITVDSQKVGASEDAIDITPEDLLGSRLITIGDAKKLTLGLD